MARLIDSLEHVEMSKGPGFEVKRQRGAKAKGIAFENKLAKWCAKHEPIEFVHGQWFRFRDKNGWGYCQPDLLSVLHDRVIIVEAKLSETPAAEAQLRRLYGPVCKHLFARPVILVQAFKYLKAKPLDPLDRPSEARLARFGPLYTYHHPF